MQGQHQQYQQVDNQMMYQDPNTQFYQQNMQWPGMQQPGYYQQPAQGVYNPNGYVDPNLIYQ
jgi:hypothetical protein